MHPDCCNDRLVQFSASLPGTSDYFGAPAQCLRKICSRGKSARGVVPHVLPRSRTTVSVAFYPHDNYPWPRIPSPIHPPSFLPSKYGLLRVVLDYARGTLRKGVPGCAVLRLLERLPRHDISFSLRRERVLPCLSTRGWSVQCPWARTSRTKETTDEPVGNGSVAFPRALALTSTRMTRTTPRSTS